MKNLLDFSRTRQALVEFDAARDAVWGAIDGKSDLVAYALADKTALDKVREAFYQDTRSSNNRADCMQVGLDFLRKTAKTNGRTKIVCADLSGKALEWAVDYCENGGAENDKSVLSEVKFHVQQSGSPRRRHVAIDPNGRRIFLSVSHHGVKDGDQQVWSATAYDNPRYERWSSNVFPHASLKAASFASSDNPVHFLVYLGLSKEQANSVVDEWTKTDWPATGVSQFGYASHARDFLPSNPTNLNIPVKNYATDWAHGGPIYEKLLHAGMQVQKRDSSEGFRASMDGWKTMCRGESPLVAALRCYVVLEAGPAIDVPNEILLAGEDHDLACSSSSEDFSLM